MALSSYRDREISGIIYFVKDEVGQTVVDKDGNPVKLNHDEAREIDKGVKTIEQIMAARPGKYPATKPVAEKPKPTVVAKEATKVVEKPKPKAKKPRKPRAKKAKK